MLSVDHWLSGEYLPPFPVKIAESRSLVVAQIHFNPLHDACCKLHRYIYRKWRQISRKSAGGGIGNRTQAEKLEGKTSTTEPPGFVDISSQQREIDRSHRIDSVS